MMSHAENVPADFTGCVVCGYKESLRFEQYKGKLTRHDWYERFNYRSFYNRYEFGTETIKNLVAKYKSVSPFFWRDTKAFAQETESNDVDSREMDLYMPVDYEVCFDLYKKGERQIEIRIKVASNKITRQDFYTLAATICDTTCHIAGQQEPKFEYFDSNWVEHESASTNTPAFSITESRSYQFAISFSTPTEFLSVEGERTIYCAKGFYNDLTKNPSEIFAAVSGIPVYVNGGLYLFKPMPEGTMFVYELWHNLTSDIDKHKELTMLGLEDMPFIVQSLTHSDSFKVQPVGREKNEGSR